MKPIDVKWRIDSWIYLISIIEIWIQYFAPVYSKPLTSQDTSHQRLSHRRFRRSKDINDNLLMYLMKFGYLPQSDLETGNLRTEDQVRDAIRTMQAFAHLPVTGVADEQTRQLMKKPRCGLPDIISDSYRSRRSLDLSGESDHSSSGRRRHQRSQSRIRRYTVQGQKWHHTNLTWSVRKGTGHMEMGSIRYQVRRALELWSRASRLTFEEINSEDADIRISFHTGYHNDGYPFDGKGTLLAHAFFPGTGIGGDAHFDDDEQWSAGDEEGAGLSFFAVAAHEFGHSLGLSHSSVQGAIMYPYYQRVSENYSLNHDDVTGIQAIYGRIDTIYPQFPATPLPTKPPTPTKKPIYPPKPTERPPWTPPSTPTPTSKPNTCDTSYDAISIIRRDLFIFKGKYFWRISEGRVVNNAPMEIQKFWYGFPSNITHIDAVYEKPTQGKEIIFFVGKHYWIFTSNNGTGPYPITQLGLPESLEKLDGAMVWGHNGKTYFFSGTAYWRFDEEVGKVELDYPRDMSMWRGVPYNIDSVFQFSDGKTYFFKGKVFWKFNDRKMSVTDRIPSLSAPFWMGCTVSMQTLENVPEEERYQVDSSALSVRNHILLLIVTAFMTTQFL